MTSRGGFLADEMAQSPNRSSRATMATRKLLTPPGHSRVDALLKRLRAPAGQHAGEECDIGDDLYRVTLPIRPPADLDQLGSSRHCADQLNDPGHGHGTTCPNIDWAGEIRPDQLDECSDDVVYVDEVSALPSCRSGDRPALEQAARDVGDQASRWLTGPVGEVQPGPNDAAPRRPGTIHERLQEIRLGPPVRRCRPYRARELREGRGAVPVVLGARAGDHGPPASVRLERGQERKARRRPAIVLRRRPELAGGGDPGQVDERISLGLGHDPLRLTGEEKVGLQPPDPGLRLTRRAAHGHDLVPGGGERHRQVPPDEAASPGHQDPVHRAPAPREEQDRSRTLRQDVFDERGMTRLRAAVFHNLPPGGALRWLRESITRSSDLVEWHLHTIDLGRADRWPGHLDTVNLGTHLASWRRHRLPIGWWAPRLGSFSQVADTETSIRLQRRIAAEIDAGGFEVAVLHHDQFTSSPAIAAHLRTPSLYYCQEARRRSFEAHARSIRSFGLLSIPAGLYEDSLRRRDIRFARSADHIFVNSRFSAESVSRAYGRAATVVPLGVDADLFSLHGDLPEAGTPYLLAVGAVDPLKAQDLVIRALSSLPDRDRPALRIVAERITPSYKAQLVEAAAAANVLIQFDRGISDVQLAAAYRGALATVCVAHLEPLGLTTMESLACGTPVIAVDEGGYREVVADGVNGWLVPRSVPELARAIAMAAASPDTYDPAALRGTVIPRWSWDAVVDDFAHRVRAIARGGPRGSW